MTVRTQAKAGSVMFGASGQAAHLGAVVRAESCGDGMVGLRLGRYQCLMDLADCFGRMHNPQRQVQEMPLVLLCLGHMGPLLEFVTTQQALRYMGPRLLLRYVQVRRRVKLSMNNSASGY